MFSFHPTGNFIVSIPCMIPTEIMKPSTPNTTMIIDNSTSSTVELMCSLNIIIPSTVTVVWLLNGSDVTTTFPNNTGNTTTLLLEDLQPSDVGVYQCVFIDINNGWILRRNISLLITG